MPELNNKVLKYRLASYCGVTNVIFKCKLSVKRKFGPNINQIDNDLLKTMKLGETLNPISFII